MLAIPGLVSLFKVMAEKEADKTLMDRVREQGVVQVLRHGDYARYVSTSWIAMIGMWLQRIGIGWLTWELTHSGAWLGAIALGNSLPAILLVPFAGAIADRMDRLRLLQIAQGFQILVSTLLAVLTLAELIDIWPLFAVAVALGTLEAAATPSRMTVAPGLVPREDLSGAIALNAVAFNSATFIGPAIAGGMIGSMGIGITFALNAAAYLPHYSVLFYVRLRAAEHASGSQSSITADIVDAIRYVVGHSGIAPILLLAFIGSLLVRHLPDLMPGFADHVFNGGPETLGALMSAFGAGGMFGSLWIANRNSIHGTTVIFFVGLLGNAVFVFVFAVTDILWIGMAAVALFGFTMASSGNSAQILVQHNVDGRMRARVMSLYSLTFRGGPAIGAMIFGGLSASYGLQLPIAAGAGLCFIAGLIVMRRRNVIAEILETAA